MSRLRILKMAQTLSDIEFQENEIKAIFYKAFRKDSNAYLDTLKDYQNTHSKLSGAFVFLTGYLDDNNFKSLNEAFISWAEETLNALKG